MDWLMYFFDKFVLLFIFILALAVMKRQLRALVPEMYDFVRSQWNKGDQFKTPSLKQSAEIVAWKMAPEIGNGVTGEIRAFFKRRRAKNG